MPACVHLDLSNHDTSSAHIALLTIYDGGPGKFKVAIRPLFGKRLKKLIAQIACYTKY